MFIMNSKNKKIFSRIAAGVMTVAMAITLLPGTMKTVNAAEPVTSASLDVILYKRAEVYAPNTTFEFEVTNLTAEAAKGTNGGNDLKPQFKNAPAGAVTPKAITLTPKDGVDGDLGKTSIKNSITFDLTTTEFTAIGTYRYTVKQKNSNYEGIKYDEDERYLDVTVARDEKDDSFYIASANLILPTNDGLVKGGVFVNTYGVKKPDPTTPADPTTPPTYPENPKTEPDGTVNDLVISKNVTGNYGEKDKDFEFQIKISGADGEYYNLGGTQKIEKNTPVTIKLRHGQKMKICGLSKTDTYTIKELEATDYTTTFKTKVNGSDKAAGDGTGKEVTEGTIVDGTSLQTQEVEFTNNRGGSATGFVLSYGPYALMVVLAGAVAFVLFRKRRAEY